MNITIKYRPHAKQAGFHAAGKRFQVLRAGVRSGKTVAAANEFIKRILSKRGLYWIVGPNFTVMRTAEATFRFYMPRDLVADHKVGEKKYLLVNGSVVEMRSADNPETLVAAGLDGVWIDEAARIARKAWDEGIYGRLLDKGGWALFSTTPKGRNWLYDTCMTYPQLYGADFAHFQFRSLDNTVICLCGECPQNKRHPCPGLAKEIEIRKRSLPPVYFKQDYEGSFESFTGACYPEYDPPVHDIDPTAIPDKSAFHRVIAGVDWGYSHPAVITVLGICADRIYVVDELWERGLLVEEAGLVGKARALMGRWGIELFVADPSEPGNIEKFRRSGLTCKMADNSVTDGIQAVATALHVRDGGLGPRLRISKRCEQLRRTLPLYHWKEKKSTGEAMEEPEKADDHACDALRYATMEADKPMPDMMLVRNQGLLPSQSRLMRTAMRGA